jgi:V-type H+-transporting ATPase subunit D
MLLYYTQNLVSSNILSTVNIATFGINVTPQRIGGISTQKFESYNNPDINRKQTLLGLHQGGQQITSTKKSYLDTLLNIIKAAELQISFIRMEEEIKLTRRRVNAIRQVLIPRYNNTIRYIEEELDQRDREDFYRLKKVQQKKQKEIELANDELRKYEVTENQSNHIMDSDSEDNLLIYFTD